MKGIIMGAKEFIVKEIGKDEASKDLVTKIFSEEDIDEPFENMLYEEMEMYTSVESLKENLKEELPRAFERLIMDYLTEPPLIGEDGYIEVYNMEKEENKGIAWEILKEDVKLYDEVYDSFKEALKNILSGMVIDKENPQGDEYDERWDELIDMNLEEVLNLL